jgi:hypothetical protein
MRKALLIPLAILSVPPTYLAGLGAAACWAARRGMPSVGLPAQFFSAALHLGWIAAASRHQASAVMLVCFPLSVWLCRQGWALVQGEGVGWWAALCLEAIPLALAWSFTSAPSWADRFARYRRARAALSAQLHMGPGLFPWLRDSARQFFSGAPDRAAGAGHQRFLAELADAECRLRVRLADLALPEQLRQSVLSCASELRAQAELASARLHFELEQQALVAAATCREQCEAMDELAPAAREHLARECELLFANLIRQLSSVVVSEVL